MKDPFFNEDKEFWSQVQNTLHKASDEIVPPPVQTAPDSKPDSDIVPYNIELRLFLMALAAMILVLFFTYYPGKENNEEKLPVHTDANKDNPSMISEEEPPVTQSIQTDASMYRGNAGRTGYYPGALGTRKSGIKNKGLLFVNCDRYFPPDKSVGFLQAYDANSGILVWETKTGIPAGTMEFGGPVESSPVVIEGIIYTSSGLDKHSNPGSLFALDAQTGTTLWKKKSDEEFLNSFAVANKVLYALSRKGTLYAYHAVSGKELWRFQSKTQFSIHHGPLLSDRTVLLYTQEALLAVNTKTGKETWRISPPPGSLFQVGNLSIAGNSLYVSGSDYQFVSYNMRNGQEKWNVAFDNIDQKDGVSRIPTRITSHGKYLYTIMGEGDDTLRALNIKNGTKIWDSQVEDVSFIDDVIIVHNGIVYLTSYIEKDDGLQERPTSLHALNAKDGKKIWKLDFQNELLPAHAIGGNNTLFTMSLNSLLYSINIKSGKIAWQRQLDTNNSFVSGLVVSDYQRNK